MNNLSQILISATVGSLVTLAITVSPLIAQNRTATPTPPSNSTGQTAAQQKMMSDMHQMMEKCKSKMESHKKPTATQTQHNQHHPKNETPKPNSSGNSVQFKPKAI